MTTRLGLISDIHSSLEPLDQALDTFAQQQVDNIICAGDIAGYGEDNLEDVISRLKDHNCIMISGNHDDLSDIPDSIYDKDNLSLFFDSLPLYKKLLIENKSIYVVHAEPPDCQHGGIKLLDPDGNIFQDRLSDWQNKLEDFPSDILIVGHTHQVFTEQIGSTLVINPGSTKFNHSCMTLSLPDMTVKTFALGGKEIVPTWNWGIFYKEGGTVVRR